MGSACARPELEPSVDAPEGVEITITAVREGFVPDTKTIREPDGSVEWCPMDEISVFYGDGKNGGSRFTSQNTEQAAVAEFKGRLEGIHAGSEDFTDGKYLYGVYPYSTSTSFSNGVTTISLPSHQTAAEGTFANGLFPTIARAQGVNLAFYNICGGVKFTVFHDDITSVTLKGNNGERLAGTANVIFDEAGKPAVLEDEAGGNEEVTVYAPAGGTFEVGKNYFIVAYPASLSSGYTITFRTSDMREGTYVSEVAQEIQRSMFGELTAVDESIESWTDITSNGGGNNSGIYLGIMGFNQQLYSYPISELIDENKTGFDAFIDDLSTKNGTLLYYSVDKAVTAMQSTNFPDDLYNVAVVTFTDGLDQGSMMMNSSYGTDEAYLAAVHERLTQEKVSGRDISAYSIGVRGKDVTDVDKFYNNLEQLASEPVNATDQYSYEVSDMEGLNAAFQTIAGQLEQTSFVQRLSITIPGQANGTKVRFTLDNITSANKSEQYIEGIFDLTSRSLTDVIYDGLTSTSGTTVKGSVDGIFVNFIFDGIQTDNKVVLSQEYIQQWSYITSTDSWQINSEFDKTENAEVVNEKRSMAIMLVLDCSSSLGDDFAALQEHAKSFIAKLLNKQDETDPSDPDNYPSDHLSTKPLDLSLSVVKDGKRYYVKQEEYADLNKDAYTIEGLCVVDGTDTPFIIALKNASTDYMGWSIANSLYDLPTYNQGVVISSRWTDINNALKVFGGNTINLIWTSAAGSNSSSHYYIDRSGGSLYTTSYNDVYVRPVVSINNLPVPWLTSPENDLTLAVNNGKTRLFIDKDEYLANGVPSGYTVEGLAVCSRLGDFIIALANESSDYMYHYAALQMYGEDALPTYNQGRVISARWTDVNDALKVFGGSAITSAWTSEPYSSTSSNYYYISKSQGILYSSNGSSNTCYVRLIVDDDLYFSADTGGDGGGELPPGYEGWN